MDWNKLLSNKRLGMEDWRHGPDPEDRSQFQRDYDRIIFSSPFRRMQNKTQIFPLPEHIFVHNRLTHSLEVASAGRSLGNLLADKLIADFKDYQIIREIGTIVSSACLAHDLGNPPFGHSGEAAISNFFENGAGREFRNKLTKEEWNDFARFDGNANALRLLTHQFNGKRPGGFALTFPTLASIVKYPYESILATRQKFGFFQSEKMDYRYIAEELGIYAKETDPDVYVRYPLVFLVEAADDICYQIMDLEDACKLGILSHDKVKELYMGFYDPAEDRDVIKNIETILKKVTDRNEQISFLRAGVIGKLVRESMSVFFDNYDDILNGNFDKSLIGSLGKKQAEAMKEVIKISFSDVYAFRSVVEIEIAGFKIIGTLLEEFVGAVIHPEDKYNKRILTLLPGQYKPESKKLYHKIQSAVDFISGMTDVYALDLYRKIKGISLPEVV
ncbi:MAG: dNTP triphosphohydrolase [Prolixibacteraceae bacterium]|jgi:dGTPase|nr:dNTP triphosphohydrolase [Prolixibacteraceae bacterium]MDD4755436.1 dNTP triphosphohydrolase [Prolixibacteraceae bacterium]